MRGLLYCLRLTGIALILAIPGKCPAQVSGAGINTSFGSFSGLVFGDYFYKLHQDSIHRGLGTQYAGVPKDFNAFDIRRFYLRHRYTFNARFSSEIIIAHDGNVLPDGNRDLYLKVASLKWTGIFKGSDMIIGQQLTPTFVSTDGSDQAWAYRSIERTIMDMRRVSTNSHSIDLGVGLFGHYKDSLINYEVLAANNSGARLASSPSKRVYADVYTKFWGKRIEIQAYVDYVQSNFNYYQDVNNIKTQYQTRNVTMKALLAYFSKNKKFSLGIEPFIYIKSNIARNSSNTGFLSQKQQGISMFAHYTVIEDNKTKTPVLRAFLRYDKWDPDANYKDDNTPGDYIVTKATAAKENFMVGGIDWLPGRNVHIMPNVWYNRYITKTNKTNGALSRNDYDLVARLTFFYTF